MMGITAAARTDADRDVELGIYERVEQLTTM
jgi:hypothetical protein